MNGDQLRRDLLDPTSTLYDRARRAPVPVPRSGLAGWLLIGDNLASPLPGLSAHRVGAACAPARFHKRPITPAGTPLGSWWRCPDCEVILELSRSRLVGTWFQVVQTAGQAQDRAARYDAHHQAPRAATAGHSRDDLAADVLAAADRAANTGSQLFEFTAAGVRAGWHPEAPDTPLHRRQPELVPDRLRRRGHLVRTLGPDGRQQYHVEGADADDDDALVLIEGLPFAAPQTSHLVTIGYQAHVVRMVPGETVTVPVGHDRDEVVHVLRFTGSSILQETRAHPRRVRTS